MNQEIIVYSIIVTFNGKEWIERSVESLLSSTFPSNIIVVDNASIDGTVDIIREKFPMVELVESETNLGFGKANNIGIRKAFEKGADYFFLLNQDAWVKRDTVEKLIQIQKDFPRFHILSPIHLNGLGDAIDINFQDYLANKKSPGFISDLFLQKLKPVYEGSFVNAAAWLVTSKCIQLLGGFDPLFQHYGEDTDFINRAQGKSLKLGIVPAALIYHDRDQTGKMNEMYYKNIIYNRALLYLKSVNKKPKRHLLIRKILASYFELYFVYMGKNESLMRELEYNFMLLKLLGKVKM